MFIMIWLIGAGDMSASYLKVLKAQDKTVKVVGRGSYSAKIFEDETGQAVEVGGLDTFLNQSPEIPEAAIVCVGAEELFNASKKLLDYGVKRLLVEKPGGLSLSEIETLKFSAIKEHAEVFIAYNRRFYSSVLEAYELIKADGGVMSFNFEFTEWSHVIEGLDKNSNVLAKWFIANSTHVADLAFFLGGKPENISCYTSGGVNWHPSSSVFAGAGVAENGALFNYSANWESSGRWSVEILTSKNRYVLRPMEALQVQAKGTVNLEFVAINNVLDTKFKPGLYLQVESFLNGELRNLCSIDEHCSLFPIYEKMASYTD